MRKRKYNTRKRRVAKNKWFVLLTFSFIIFMLIWGVGGFAEAQNKPVINLKPVKVIRHQITICDRRQWPLKRLISNSQIIPS